MLMLMYVDIYTYIMTITVVLKCIILFIFELFPTLCWNFYISFMMNKELSYLILNYLSLSLTSYIMFHYNCIIINAVPLNFDLRVLYIRIRGCTFMSSVCQLKVFSNQQKVFVFYSASTWPTCHVFTKTNIKHKKSTQKLLHEQLYLLR